MEIVLFSPDIAQNVGNIARTCAATGTRLVLVRPLGFSLSSRQMKRAGLDYWDQLELEVVDDLDTYLEQTPCPTYFFSTKASDSYTSIAFEPNARLVFGSESAGLNEETHQKYSSQFYTIPMRKETRSLNLSNSVAIVLFEGLRQQNFSSL